MGLFRAKQGKNQGWLATLLCCAVDVDVDEHDTEKSHSRRKIINSRWRVKHKTNLAKHQRDTIRTFAMNSLFHYEISPQSDLRLSLYFVL